MILIILLTAGFIFYSLLNGITEALYYDYVYFKNRNHPNIHPVYVLERSLVIYLMATRLPADIYSYWHCAIFAIALCLLYSFFHNGMYGVVRNNFNPDVYKKRWWANKEAGEANNAAKWEIEAGFRTAMAVVGLVFIYGVYISAHA